MEPNLQQVQTEHPPADGDHTLPFPFNQQTFCRYESIEQTIDAARVLVVDNLLRDEGDVSDVARSDWGKEIGAELKREREIASLAMQNIVTNVKRLVKQPATRIAHVSEVAEAVEEFKPDAIVLSGTLRDFDYYKPQILDTFKSFITATQFAGAGHLRRASTCWT